MSELAQEVVNVDMPSEKDSVRCPVCNDYFPKSLVDRHAAACDGFALSMVAAEDESQYSSSEDDLEMHPFTPVFPVCMLIEIC